MNEVISVYTPGVIADIEQFTFADEELRQFVIYTYYDKNEEPLYVGASKEFYAAHHFNATRLDFFKEAEYVGFVFLENEPNMKEAKPYYIRARQPKYGRSKYPKLPYLKGCDVFGDDYVVSRAEMEQRWHEWLAPDDGEASLIMAEHEAEIAAWLPILCSILKIKERDLTEEEETYAWKWFGMGADKHTLKKAYETTVIRSGGFSWQYMHRLLKAWLTQPPKED